MLQACASGATFLLESSFQTHQNRTQNKLVSGLKYAVNMHNILLGEVTCKFAILQESFEAAKLAIHAKGRKIHILHYNKFCYSL